MNEAFYALEEEKQRAVFNAAMKVFSRWEYKRASTDLIAAKAGVSKGLLFYIFPQQARPLSRDLCLRPAVGERVHPGRLPCTKRRLF